MSIGEIREENQSRRAFSHLPLSSAGGANLGQAPREETAYPSAVEPDKPKSAPPPPPFVPRKETGAPAAQPGLPLPATIFGIPTPTVIKIALGLSLAGGVIGLVVKLRALFSGGKGK